MKRLTRIHLVRKRGPAGPDGRQELGPLDALSLDLEPAGSLGVSVMRTQVHEVMRRGVQSICVDLSVESATWLLLERGLDGAPVVDLLGQLVGYLSMSDLLRERFERGETHETRRIRDGGPRSEDPGFSSTEIASSTVGEIMSPITLTVRGSSSLMVAAALMGFEEVQALPVVRRGRLIGVLTSLDILRWLSTRTGYTGAAREELDHLANPS